MKNAKFSVIKQNGHYDFLFVNYRDLSVGEVISKLLEMGYAEISLEDTYNEPNPNSITINK